MFKWTEVEEEEFQEVKKRLKTIIPVTPVDTSKPLMIYTDASNSGLGWILTQRKNNQLNLDENWKENQIVIEMGSTSLSECQSRYSPVEKEMLAAVTEVTKLDFFCRAAPEVHIFSDCSTLVNITRKDFSEISNTRLLRLLEKVSGYNLTFHHLPGSRYSISD